MALIKCPICGNDVSTHSTECPKCGEPVHEEPPTPEQKLKFKERLKKQMNSCLCDIALATITLIAIGCYWNRPVEYRLYKILVPAIFLLTYLIKFLVLQKKYEREF